MEESITTDSEHLIDDSSHGYGEMTHPHSSGHVAGASGISDPVTATGDSGIDYSHLTLNLSGITRSEAERMLCLFLPSPNEDPGWDSNMKEFNENTSSSGPGHGHGPVPGSGHDEYGHGSGYGYGHGPNGHEGVHFKDRAYCERDWDGLLCWPSTPEGFSATLNCFEEFRGIYYDKTKTVTRDCEPGGSWQNVTDYASSCVPLRTGTAEVADENVLGIQLQVYFFGYCLSLTALMLAIIIFLAFNRSRQPTRRDRAEAKNST